MIKALVLTGDGINCESETAYALEQADAQADITHISDLIAAPERLQDYRILALPGGFSFGDEVSSGKILAIKLRYAIGEALQEFIEADKMVIGVCNGFQALVKLGLLPQSDKFEQQVTLTHNRQHRFINRWVALNPKAKSIFFEGIDSLTLPIRHGEGRLMVPQGQEETMAQTLKDRMALVYESDVNGSFQNIAGLVNEKGNVLGLMPHPEAFVRWTQHPAWTSLTPEEKSQTPPGLQIFQNMVKALRN